MNLLLGLVTLTGFMSPVIGTTTNYNTVDVSSKNIETYEKINLTKVKAKPSTTNLNWAIETTTKEEIKENILLDIIESNSDNDIIIEAILDVLYNPSEWSITGMNFEVPPLNTEVVYSTKILARSSNELFTGFLSVDVTLKNEGTTNDLNDIIKVRDLGVIVNPTEDYVFKQIIKENPNLVENEIIIDEINYQFAIIKPKTDYYSGSAKITFKTEIEWDVNWESEKIEKEAYNSTQYGYDETTFTYNMEFGLENFRRSFSRIEVTYSGESMVKDYTSEVLETYNHESTTMSINASHLSFWDRNYTGSVNWNWTKSYLDIDYNNWTIDFNFKVEVKAYASWINTWKSKAVGQITIEGINFY